MIWLRNVEALTFNGQCGGQLWSIAVLRTLNRPSPDKLPDQVQADHLEGVPRRSGCDAGKGLDAWRDASGFLKPLASDLQQMAPQPASQGVL